MFEFIEPGEFESEDQNLYPKSKQDVYVIESHPLSQFRVLKKQILAAGKNYLWWKNFDSTAEAKLFYLDPDGYFLLLVGAEFDSLPENII